MSLDMPWGIYAEHFSLILPKLVVSQLHIHQIIIISTCSLAAILLFRRSNTAAYTSSYDSFNLLFGGHLFFREILGDFYYHMNHDLGNIC